MALEISLPDSGSSTVTNTELGGGTSRQSTVHGKQRKQAITQSTLFARRKVTTQDRMFFTEQLSLMLATGTSLHPALESIAQQMSKTPLQPVISAMADGVLNGRSLSQEMSQHPQVFSPMYVSLVAASENGGFLHEVLEQLRSIEEQNDELRSTLISAFSYPAFLVVFSIFTLGFVLLFVFPKFADLFASIGDQLPGSTKVLMSLSGFLLNNWLLTLVAIGIALAGFVISLNSTKGRTLADRFKLYTPPLCRIWRQVYIILLLRILGLSLQHGVSLVDAVRISRDVVDNGLVRKFLADLSDVIEQGGRLAFGLGQAAWVPDLAKQMLATAEESGSLAPVMLRLADYYTRELNRLLQKFSKMVEPIMLVVMGALVGLLVSAMILPIFKLSHSVG